MVVGVAGAAVDNSALPAAGVAAVIAGALSMAGGEYVSVSSQRDSQKAEPAHGQRRLDTDPADEVDHLAGLFAAQGNEAPVARQELGIEPGRLTSPWQAAWTSTAAFVLGALVPLVAILTAPAEPPTGVRNAAGSPAGASREHSPARKA